MKEKIWTKDFLLLCLLNVILFTGFFFLMPTLPLFLVEELGGREDQAGLVIGIFTISALLVRPITGVLLDQLGRKRILLISFFMYVLAVAGYLAVFSLVLLLLLRLLHGAAFGMVTTGTGTVVADLVPERRRGEALGYYGALSIFAMVIGPFLGLLIARHWSYTAMFVICVGLSLIALIISLAIRYPQSKKADPSSVVTSLRQWRKMFELRAIPYSVAVIGLAATFGGIISFISLYATQLGDVGMAGWYFFVYALALVVSRLFSGRIHDRMGPDLVVYPGLVFYLLGVIALGGASGPVLFYTAAALIGFGYGSIQPSLQAMVIESAPDRRGAATATFFTAIDVGIGMGAFALGFVATQWGYSAMYFSSSFLVIFSGILYWRARIAHSGTKESQLSA